MIRDWQDGAACRQEGIDPEMFFADTNASVYRAKLTCLACPVRAQCERSGRWEITHLDAELAPEDVGIWGGLTGRELARAEDRPVRSTRKLARDRGITLLLQGMTPAQVCKALRVRREIVHSWYADIQRERSTAA